MKQPIKHVYAFGPFRLDPDEHLLLRDGQVVSLPPKVFDTLLVLVENGGHVMDKDELLRRIWPDTFVEEVNLAKNVFVLRKALGKDCEYIETVPKRGYRFVAAVRELSGDDLVLREDEAGSIVQSDNQEWETENENAVKGEDAKESRSASGSRDRKWRLIAVSLALIAVVAAIVYLRIASRPKRAEKIQVQSIAVLPLRSLSQNADDEPLGLGIADALITKLSHISKIIVRPTSSVHKYTQLPPDPLAAGREQRVDAVLEGSFQQRGDKIRVTVRLLSVEDGLPLWSYKCDDQCADVLTMQDSISEQVTEALELRLTSEEKQLLAKHHTENRDAYQAYVMGRYFWSRRTTENLKKGIQYFEQAVAKDATDAFAHAGLADCYTMLAINRALPEKEAYPKARAAAIRAMEIDSALSEVHSSLGHLLMLDWEWEAAEREFKLAVELNPHYAPAHQWYAIYLSMVGRPEEAIGQMKEALAIDPVSVFTNMDFGWVLFRARQYDLTIAQCQKVVEIDPNFDTNSLLALAYEQQGRYAEAVAARVKVLALTKASSASITSLKDAYAAAGMKGYWRRRLAQVLEESKQRPISPFNMALMYIPLGEKEQALKWLQIAYDERDWGIVLLRTDPRLDSLRSDQKFTRLMRRVGLVQ
jgi:DNA-binding winged helix-turn-helix (wHTH) protein/TolB-like protein/Flp pilus assembly protein TadD